MSKKVEWSEKKIKLGDTIIYIVIALVVGLAIGLFVKGDLQKYGRYLGISSADSQDWSALDEVYNKVAANYDGEIDQDKMIEGAKKGLVAALGDVYTVYMDREESQEFNDSLHGNVGSGVGIEMGLRDGYVRVLRTLPDNPARKAGILAGDIIYKVNDEEVYSLSADEVSQRIRGETGTEVSITVVRNNEEKTFKMKRETINNVSAYVDYDGDIAIITVTRFDNDTGINVQKFAAEFKDKGVKKVILDLRDNGGGYVNAAQDLISLWVDGDVALIQKSKHDKDVVYKTSSGKATLKDMKTVVLVNGSTASASEIVAGALHDYEKATIVGEKTFGKGVVQNLYNLSNYTSLKVTTASWYTPKGNTINKTGIEPDIKVERTFDDINTMKDPQLKKAKELLK